MPVSGLLDQRLAKALSHPLRRRVLDQFTQRVEASPNEVAKALEIPLSTVSYHVHILRELECIALVRTVPRRGAVEHFYRSTLDIFLDDTQWSTLPTAVRRQLAGQTIGDLMREIGAAATGGGFDEPAAAVARVPLRLDEAGWAELSELLHATLRDAAAIQERSDERGDDVRQSLLALLHFARGDREG
jgi:DNA-binding transcriptional ArsR family regulator